MDVVDDWTPVSLSLFLQRLSIVTLKGTGVFFMEWKPAMNSLQVFLFFVYSFFLLCSFVFSKGAVYTQLGPQIELR